MNLSKNPASKILPCLLLLGVWLLVSSPARAFHHPHDVVDCLALNPEYPKDPRVFLSSLGSINLFLVSHNRGYTWMESRSGLHGTKVYDMAIASNWKRSQTAFAALGPEGLQKSVDGGTTWQPPCFAQAVFHVAIAPVVSGKEIVFVAGRRNLYRSPDGGKNWTKIEAPFSGRWISSLAVSPAFHKDGVVAVTTKNNRVNLSRDGGNTWEDTVLGALPTQAVFSPDFANDRTLFVTTHGSKVLWSTDGGATFSPRSTGIKDADVNDLVLAPGYPDCPDLFVATRNDGVYRSVDRGATWSLTSLRVPKTFQTQNHHLMLNISPQYPKDGAVFCGTFEGLFISNDRGEHWRKSNINPTRMGRKVGISPDFAKDDTVFFSGYGMQMITSENRGDTWGLYCTDIYALSGYAFAVSPDYAEDRLIMLGVDRGCRRTTDAGETWTSIELEPHTLREVESSYEVRQITFSPDFTNDQLVFAISKGGLFRSEDAGQTWSASAPPPTNYAARVVLSPEWTKDKLMLGAGTSLHRSTDEGKTWSEPVFDNLTNEVVFAPDFATTREVYLISGKQGFARSTDGARSFELHNDGLEGFMPAAIQMSPDFVNDSTLFIATIGGGLFRSTDRGLSWQRVTKLGSPVDSTVSFVISPDFHHDQTMYIGNFRGMWRSTDGGQSWELKTNFEYYDDGRQPWVRHGPKWKTPRIPGCLTRGVSVSWHRDHKITLPFTGTRVELYGTKGPDHGLAQIILNDDVVATIDCYDPAPKTQQILFDSELDWGYHTLAINVLGRKGEGDGSKVAIDGAVVYYQGPQDEVPVYGTQSWQDQTPQSTSDIFTPGNPVSSLQWIIIPVIGLVVVLLLVISLRRGFSGA